MSDLSLPPLSMIPADGLSFDWPTPQLPGFPAPTSLSSSPPCELEGLNGRIIEGRLSLFDPTLGLLNVRVPNSRKPLSVRLDQFRRVRLLDPLLPAPAADARDLLGQRPVLDFHLRMKGGEDWKGRTLAPREESWGLFLFEPDGEGDAVRRWFVPRAAIEHAELGPLLGQALVGQHSVTPDQLHQALHQQEKLRSRKLGDAMVVRQLISADDLAAALAHQARMPMVRIGEALTALGYITEAQLQEALVQQRADRSVPLGELLVRSGWVSREHLQIALARKMGYPMVDVLQFPSDAEAVARLPYAIASRVQALPLMMRAGRLVVAIVDPGDRKRLDEIEFAAQCKVVPVLATGASLLGAIDRAYEKVGAADFAWRSSDAPSLPIEFETSDASKLVAVMEQSEGLSEEVGEDGIAQSDNTLVRLINSMIVEAHNQGVSDIHIECPAGKEKVRIRFRKDGQLRPYLELPPAYRGALVSRLKIMCDLDISEKRKPQDGKINFSKFVQGLKLELRVATIPTHGNLEDAVIRLLASNKPIPLEHLGLSPANLQHFQAATSRPYGLILCVGPTGSGKTTTLHSALSSINRPDRKIWTAEDPIEITQFGLRQVQVNPRIDWTFAKALRAFLRADPDVIMVGEVRDSETGQVAIEASLTGHLVLSTLHTNSAPETVTRLLDMGMDPFNFADALLVVLAQRLVRRLCTQCRVARTASVEEEEELLRDYLHPMAALPEPPAAEALLAEWHSRFGSLSSDEDGGTTTRLTLYRSVGCEHCNHTGYRGRAGIHELMTVTRTLRHLIQTGSRSDDLQTQALGDGMRTLRQDGIEKVLAGVTTIEEVRANS